MGAMAVCKLQLLALAVLGLVPFSVGIPYDVTTVLDANKAGRQFSFMSRPATDARGEYVAASDHGKNSIWKIYTSGNVSVELLAGAPDGSPGFADGPADVARFQKPMSLDVDGEGNVYVADAGNNAIRVIDPRGNVETIAGNGAPGRRDGAGNSSMFSSPSDVTYDAATCTVLVTDRGNGLVRRLSSPGKCSRPRLGGGAAANAHLGYLGSLVVGAAIAAVFFKWDVLRSRVEMLLHGRLPSRLTVLNTLAFLLPAWAGLYLNLAHTTFTCAISLLLLALKSFWLHPSSPPSPTAPQPEATMGATSRGRFSAMRNGRAKRPQPALPDLLSFHAEEASSHVIGGGGGAISDMTVGQGGRPEIGTSSGDLQGVGGMCRKLSGSVSAVDNVGDVPNLMDDDSLLVGSMSLGDFGERIEFPPSNETSGLTKRHGWPTEEETGLPLAKES